MENLKAQKLLNKIQKDLMRNGIITNTIVEELKDLRALVVEEQIPLLAKALRLTYEHIAENDDFLIAIPDDDPITETDEEAEEDVEETEVVNDSEEITGKESLEYLLSLMADHSNKLNEMELREYVKALKEEAGEDY
ncbi:hypothetical protein [Gramella sp. AN32]|uniref:Uncharacterized protein n=1 Tax=Christiangramia antarctica TaxID=2058158 RepID=A0ABW5XBS0_9FLAO|nr:hypothetical protein [Gramella sp. AN32]MCM4157366.1 hypothetical protein [Gramella sp. AN32]